MKRVGVLTPTEIFGVMTKTTNSTVEAIHRPYDSSTGKDEVLEKITITDALVERSLLERDGAGDLIHTIEMSGSAFVWEFDGGTTSVSW